jgi:hypothetical protein
LFCPLVAIPPRAGSALFSLALKLTHLPGQRLLWFLIIWGRWVQRLDLSAQLADLLQDLFRLLPELLAKLLEGRTLALLLPNRWKKQACQSNR